MAPKPNLRLILFIFLALAILLVGAFFLYKEIKNKNTPLVKDNKTDLLTQADFGNLTWEESEPAPWEERDSHGFVVYKGKIWLMGGVNGTKRLIAPGNVDYGNAPHFDDVWFSEDGKTWQMAADNTPWGKRRSMQVVDFKGKMWLMGGWGPEIGVKRDIWSSEDGKKWKLEKAAAKWPAREGHQVVVFQNKLWLMGGVNYSARKVFNDIWVSEDGINWTQPAQNANWRPRWDFSSTVFQNKLWVAGGMDLSQNMFNDVWSSEDGANWTLATNNPPFSPRQGLITEYAGKIWIIGRLNDATNKGVNDVWYSDDGITWQKTKKDPEWTGREDFGGVIFKNEIWIFGGMDKNWSWRNDVWHSSLAGF